MSKTKSEVVEEIRNKIYDNTEQAITGDILQGVLVDMVDVVPEEGPFVSGEGEGSAVLSESESVATGEFAVAEGANSTASGDYSHAEGKSKASGSYSHAEGDSTAEGNYSHAEGGSTASGAQAHAEGNNSIASGANSHAEGYNTTASAAAAHAEGQGTIATNPAEHAQGSYNKSNANTIHSIGMGVDNDNRKNIVEVMNNGDIYIYGVGGYDGTNPSNSTPLNQLVGQGYQYAGLATTSTSPGTPEGKVFYVATQTGTYTNFGGLVVAEGEVAILKYDGTNWSKDVTGAATKEEVSQLGQKVNNFIAGDIFTEDGFWNPTAGTFYPHSSWKSTKKIMLQGRDINGYFYLPGSVTNGAAVFFKADGSYAGEYHLSTAKLGENTIPVSVFPNEAVYVAISTLVEYLEQSYINYGVQPEFVLYDMANDSIEKVKEETERFKTFGKELFCISGYYDARNGQKMASTMVTTTPILKIYGDIWLHTYFGGSTYPQYGICYFDENQNFISGSAGTTAGVQDVHIAVSEMPSNAKYFVVSTLNTYLPDASVVCSWNGPSYDLSQKVNGLPERVADVENQLTFLDALQGLKFNSSEAHQLAKQAIKAIWLTYGTAPSSQHNLIDALRESLANTKLYIQDLYNVEGTYGCFLQIKDAASGGNNCFSKFVVGIHTITGDEEVWDVVARQNTLVWPSDSGITGYPFLLHIAIDWNLLNNKRITTNGDNPIELDFGELHWGERVDSASLKEEVKILASQQRSVASIDLSGKNIICIGDSLTEFTDSNNKRYSDYISERTGATTINIGFGGTQLRQRREMAEDFDLLPESTEAEIAEKSRYAYATIDIINLVKAIVTNDFTEQTKAVNWLANHGDDNTAILLRAKQIDWSKVDGVTIFAGTNDWASNNPVLGPTGGNDPNYTLGAINEIIRLLLSTFKQLKIYWFTPIVRWVDYSGGAGTDAGWSDVKIYNDTDGTLKQFAAAIENEVRFNHIPVCDLYNTLGWNKNNFSEYFNDNDGTHPRKVAGATFLAKKIGAFILANNTL